MAETVATETRLRGPEAASSRFGRFLALALALHLPLTPIGPLLGLLALLAHRGREVPEEHLNSIPVSLLSDEDLEQLGMKAPDQPPPSAPAPGPGDDTAPAASSPPKPKPTPKPKPVVSRPSEPDAGVEVTRAA